jgi:hypothetical protein
LLTIVPGGAGKSVSEMRSFAPKTWVGHLGLRTTPWELSPKRVAIDVQVSGDNDSGQNKCAPVE